MRVAPGAMLPHVTETDCNSEAAYVTMLRPQRVHVGIWYILRAQRGSHIPTLRPKYIPYSYMDPLGDLRVFHCEL